MRTILRRTCQTQRDQALAQSIFTVLSVDGATPVSQSANYTSSTLDTRKGRRSINNTSRGTDGQQEGGVL